MRADKSPKKGPMVISKNPDQDIKELDRFTFFPHVKKNPEVTPTQLYFPPS